MALERFDPQAQLSNVKKVFSGVTEMPKLVEQPPRDTNVRSVYPIDKSVIQQRRREMTPARTDDPIVSYLNNNAPEWFMVDLPKAEKLLRFVKQENPDLQGEDVVKKAVEYLPSVQEYENEQRVAKQTTQQTQTPMQWGIRRWVAWNASLEWTMLEWLEPVNKQLDKANLVWRFTQFIDESAQKIPAISRESMANALKWTPFEWMEVLPTMVANAPGSLVKTATATARGITNPFDTIIGLSKLALTEEWRQAITDRYGSIEWLKKTMTEDPVWLASDALTLVQWWAWLASKWAKIAWMTDTASKLSNISNVAWGAADLWLSTAIPKWLQKVTQLWDNLWQKGLLWQAGNTVVKWLVSWMQPVKAITESTKWLLDRGLDFVQDTKLWLTKEEVKWIQNNPYQWEYRNETKQVIEQQWVPQEMNTLTLAPNEALKNTIQEAISSYEKVHSDSWPLYQEIEKLNTLTDLTKVKKPIVDNLYNRYSIKVKSKPNKKHPNWVLDFAGTEFEWLTNLQTQIQNAFDVATSSKSVNPKEFMNKRRSLDNQAKREWRPTKATPVVKLIRWEVDKIWKEAIPWLKETDQLRSKQLKELQEMKNKLVYESWPKKWEYRDNITQIIKTLHKENRHQMLQRLEEIVPWLQQRVEAIQNLPKLAKAYTNLWKSSKLVEWAWAIVWSTVWSQLWWIPWSLIWGAVWWGVSKFLEWKMWNIRKDALDGVLSTLTPEAQAKIADIDAKILAKQALSQEDLQMVDNIKAKLQTEQSKQPQPPTPAPLVKSIAQPVSKKTPLVKATDSKNISPKVKKPLIKAQVVSKVDDALPVWEKMWNTTQSAKSLESVDLASSIKKAKAEGKTFEEFVEWNTYYRWETWWGWNYYSTDFDFARDFTPSGLDNEVMKKVLMPSDIFKSKELPFAWNVKDIDNAVAQAKKQWKKAILVSEWNWQPNSIFVFDKTALNNGKVQLRTERDKLDNAWLPALWKPLPKATSDLATEAKKYTINWKEYTLDFIKNSWAYKSIVESLDNLWVKWYTPDDIIEMLKKTQRANTTNTDWNKAITEIQRKYPRKIKPWKDDLPF